MIAAWTPPDRAGRLSHSRMRRGFFMAVWRRGVRVSLKRHGCLITGALLGCLMILLPGRASAQVGSDRYASIIVDAASGNVLSSSSPDESRHPASLTKMMTLYMTFEALRDRRISLDQVVPVSDHAASMSPTKLGLVPGSVITVEQAILGLVTLSANDAASALGEMLGGDEDRFAQMMTLRAHGLGMMRTTFENASGLPDPDQITSARDMAMLARHLIQDYPNEYRYFSTPNFVFHGRTIWNHDRMLQTYPGADGLKTGYVNASGHNLVTSAVRDDKRLIGVVLGAASNVERDQHMAALLDRGFESEGVSIVMAHRDVPWRGGLMNTADAAEAVPLEEAGPRRRKLANIRFATAIAAPMRRKVISDRVDRRGARDEHVVRMSQRHIKVSSRDTEVAELPRPRAVASRHAEQPPACGHARTRGCSRNGQLASR